MTDDGTAFLPGQAAATVPFQPRSAYIGFRAFGSGDGAVLLDPQTARELRSAAEFAARERRVAGGLLYGRSWADHQGGYLVVDGYLEARPAENPGARFAADEADDFILSPEDLRLLRQDAMRKYAADFEVGWWRTLGELGEFGPGDFLTQRELVGPDCVGLLIYGSGQHWGTAYLGPDALTPDSAGTLIATPHAALDAGPPPAFAPEAGPGAHRADLESGETPLPDDELTAEPGPERVDIGAGESLLLDDEPELVDIGAGMSLLDDEPEPEPERVDIGAGMSLLDDEPEAELVSIMPGETPAEVAEPPASGGPGTALMPRRPALLTPVPRPSASRAVSPAYAPPGDWAVRPGGRGGIGAEMPTDVKIVVGGLILSVVIAAVIIGMLLSNAMIAVIAAVVFVLVVLGFVWFTHL